MTLDPKTYHLRTLFLFFLICSAFFYDALLRSCINSIYSFLQSSPYQLTDVQIGSLAFSFFLPYAILQLLAGFLLDRISVQRVLSLSLVIISCGCLFMLTSHYHYMLTGRAMMGIGAAGLFLSGAYFIQYAFPLKKIGLFMGYYLAAGFLGGFAANAPFLYFVRWIGLANTWLILSLFGFILLLTINLFGIPLNIITTEDTLTTDSKKRLAITPAKIVLIVILIGITGGLMDTITGVFGSLWGTHFLHVTKKLPETAASFIASLVFIGYMFGCPLFGWLFSHTRKLFIYAAVAAATASFVFFILIYNKHTFSMLSILSLLLGLLAGSNLFAFRLPFLYSLKHGGFLLALSNFLVMLINSIFQLIIPYVFQKTQEMILATSIFIIITASAASFAYLLYCISGVKNLQELTDD